MQYLQNGLNNISQADGVGIAVTGLLIVFCTLVLISLFIALLPRVLDIVPPFADSHQPAAAPPAADTDRDETEVLVAIGALLHSDLQQRGR